MHFRMLAAISRIGLLHQVDLEVNDGIHHCLIVGGKCLEIIHGPTLSGETSLAKGPVYQNPR